MKRLGWRRWVGARNSWQCVMGYSQGCGWAIGIDWENWDGDCLVFQEVESFLIALYAQWQSLPVPWLVQFYLKCLCSHYISWWWMFLKQLC